MGELGDGLGLAQEAGAELFALAQAGADDLEGDFSAKGGRLPGAVDFGHAAAADALDQFVIAQPRASHICHLRLPFLPATGYAPTMVLSLISPGFSRLAPRHL